MAFTPASAEADSPDRLSRVRSRRRTKRLIALFEAFKGLAALAASIGLLGLLHHDLHLLVAQAIGHFGLNPGGRYPTTLLRYADLLQDADRRTLLSLAAGYASLRLTEAYGLWRDRAWGEWFGALSGALYIPFELRHLLHRPSFVNVAVVLINLAIVGYLGYQLWRRRQAIGAIS